MSTLRTPREVDHLLRYPRGRTAKLIKAGKFPHLRLPDGELRISDDMIEQVLRESTITPLPELPMTDEQRQVEVAHA